MVAVLFYGRAALIGFWLALTSVVIFVLCPFRLLGWDANWWYGRSFWYGVKFLTRCSVIIDGQENLTSQRPCVFLVNHQHDLDLAFCGAMVPHDVVVIGKKEILFLPFFGLLFWGAGNIVINRQKSRHAMAGLDHAAKEIRRRKISVVVFPEGTRNKTQEPMLPFKKGAFHLAIQAGVPIVPIVCSPIRHLISEGFKTLHRHEVRFRVLAPISTEGKTAADVESLVQETREKMLEAFLGLSTSRP